MERAMPVRPASPLRSEVEETLSRLCMDLDLSDDAHTAMVRNVGVLFGPAAGLSLDTPPAFRSALTDDSSPYEWSVVLDETQPELRILWESPASSDAPGERRRVGRATHRRLVDHFGAANERFETISQLFLPDVGGGAFALWHALRLWPHDGPLELKAYLNPRVAGGRQAPALVEEAFERLGLSSSWPSVAAALSRGPDLDELRYVSLDLSAETSARVKVYIYHHDPDRRTIEHAAAQCPDASPGRLADFFEEVSAGRPAAAGFAPGTCLSFTGGTATPTAVTLHVPIRGYVDSDAEAADRVDRLVGAPRSRIYRTALDAIRRRPLEAGVGLTTYLSLRSSAGPDRFTAYIATESYETMPPGTLVPAKPTRAAPVEELVDHCEEEPLSSHPFFARMSRHPIDVAHMWAMFANIYDGLSKHFVRRLAHVIARVPDERIQSLLAAQLHEELGEGDPTRTHRRLFVDLLDKLSPWKPQVVPEAMRVAGQRLHAALEAVYHDPDPYVGVGGAIVIELLGKQVDIFVADQFRRQEQVRLATLQWLTEHEALELEHAEESAVLAGWITQDDHRVAAWRGGEAVFRAGWAFFDDMYTVCFG